MGITKGYIFGATELVTNAKLHALVDDATITDGYITEAKLDITSSPVTDYLLRYDGSKMDWVAQQSLASISASSSFNPYTTVVGTGSLVSYLCSIAHGQNATIIDFTMWYGLQKAQPDDITILDANNILVDFTSYGSLASICYVRVSK
jgi:hypothetical protein